MFGFKKNKDTSVEDIKTEETPTASPMEVLKTKCRVSTIGQSEYLIAKDLDALSAEECSLLYKSWGDEFRKTSLFKKLLSDDLLYFSQSTPLIEEQFNRLNINQLHVLSKNRIGSEPSAAVYSNPLAASGLLLACEHTRGNARSETTFVIMNADKKVLLSLQKSLDTRCSLNPKDTIVNFIPGPWLSILSSDLDQIPVFKKEIVSGDELIQEQMRREMIHDAMQIN